MWILMVGNCSRASEVRVDEDAKYKVGCQRASCTPPVISICRSCHDVVSPDVVCYEQLHAL